MSGFRHRWTALTHLFGPASWSALLGGKEPAEGTCSCGLAAAGSGDVQLPVPQWEDGSLQTGSVPCLPHHLLGRGVRFFDPIRSAPYCLVRRIQAGAASPRRVTSVVVRLREARLRYLDLVQRQRVADVHDARLLRRARADDGQGGVEHLAVGLEMDRQERAFRIAGRQAVDDRRAGSSSPGPAASW